MSMYKTCQKAVWREQGEHCNIMIPNIQERHEILLSAEFCCVLKGLENKAKERNSLTTSVTSTESVWIEISSLKRTNCLTEMGSLTVICWEKSEIPRAEKTTVLQLPPCRWSNVTLEYESEIKFLSQSVQITGPEEHHSLGLDSEQSAGLGSKPRYSDSMILKI